MEQCSVVYYSKSLVRSQEIERLFEEERELPELSDHYWNDFLDHMAKERWELTGAVSVVNSKASRETVAYFKRSG